jgi:hypothetical protein
MKKTILVSALALAFLVPALASAQMMGNWGYTGTTSTSTDYGALGDRWMQSMMGSNYDQYAQNMRQIGGDSFFNQMREVMGRTWAQNNGNSAVPVAGYGTSTNCGREVFGSWFMGPQNPMWGEGHVSGWIWFFGIIAAIFGIFCLAIPIAVLVLIVVFIVKLIKSLKHDKSKKE